jgi:uncharacterized membrane protein YeaQ/YmgE (transglycosylase-associated protein family)
MARKYFNRECGLSTLGVLMEEWLGKLIGYGLHIGIGFLSAIFIYFILRRRVLGKFWLAFIMGIIGSVFGNFLLDDIFETLSDILNVNVLAALFFSCILILLYSFAAPGGKRK